MDRIETRIVNLEAGHLAPPALPHHLIDIHLGAAVHSVCRLDGRELSRQQEKGDIDILPAGSCGTWDLAGPVTALLVQLPVALMRNTARELGLRAQQSELRPTL